MRHLLLLIILALLVFGAGCTTQSVQVPEASPVTATLVMTTVLTTPPTTNPTTMATTVPTTQTPRLEIVVNSIQKYASDNPYSTPRPGYEYILVDFSIKNKGYPNGYSYNPYYVKVEDPDGYRYGYASESYSVPGYFGMVVISYSDNVRGKLLFEVPEAPTGTSYQLWVNG